MVLNESGYRLTRSYYLTISQATKAAPLYLISEYHAKRNTSDLRQRGFYFDKMKLEKYTIIVVRINQFTER